MEQRSKYLVIYSEISNFLEPNVIAISKETFLLVAHLATHYSSRYIFIITEHEYYSFREVFDKPSYYNKLNA
jgi:hypothetical protein